MSSLPKISDKVYTYLGSVFGYENAKNYLEFAEKEPSKYIRVNELKISKENLRSRLETGYGIITEELAYPSNALKVISGFDYLGSTFEIAFGLYYIQGYSSMLPPLVLNPNEKDKVLDMCSAPGSKSTQLAEMMHNNGILAVNEISLDRVKALVFNLDKMNFTNYGVLNHKGELLSKYFDAYFDKILVDAPCSGLGIIQKRADVNNWWSLDRVNRLCEIQMRLLVSAFKMLKIGGEVVYSTCSLTVEENELLINRLLKKYPVEIQNVDLPIEHRKGIIKYSGIALNPQLTNAIRIFPWEADSDGFFLIKLKKTGGIKSKEKTKSKNISKLKISFAGDVELKSAIENLSDAFGIDIQVFDNYKFIIKKNNIYFINRDWCDANLDLYHRIGTKFASFDKNRNLVLHSYAAQILHTHIEKNIYEITDAEELKIYLRGGLITSADLSPGQYVVKYSDLILGTAVATSGGLKSRFPRSNRTQKIRVKGVAIN